MRNAAYIFVLCAAVTMFAQAQILVPPEKLPSAISLLENAFSSKPSLPCSIWINKHPRLDFALRLVDRFQIECHKGSIRPGSSVIILVRVTPKAGAPVVLMTAINVPQASEQHLKQFPGPTARPVNVSMSGGFALGVGRYTVEVAVADENNRIVGKRMQIDVKPKWKVNVALTIPPLTAQPLLDVHWDGKLVDNGLNFTILLHVDPSGFVKIYDMVDLLQSLKTLLDQLPCRSVKLIAFSMERQEVVFRAEEFDRQAFQKLVEAVDTVQSGAVSWQNLRVGAWWKFLAELAQTETAVRPPADAIVILGPYGGHAGEILPDVYGVTNPHPPLFYLRFSYTGVDDAISHLIKGYNGRSFGFYSPETLQNAMRRMMSQFQSLRNEHTPENMPLSTDPR